MLSIAKADITFPHKGNLISPTLDNMTQLSFNVLQTELHGNKKVSIFRNVFPLYSKNIETNDIYFSTNTLCLNQNIYQKKFAQKLGIINKLNSYILKAKKLFGST